MTGPPRVATAILAFCLPSSHRDPIVGDLEEAFLIADGAPPIGWYWRQVFRSIWPALTLHADRANLGRLFGAVFLGFATMWVVGDIVLVGSRAGYATLFPADPSPTGALRVIYLAAMIPTCALAGYLAARSGGAVGRLAAVVLGVILIAPALVAPFVQHGVEPAWAKMIWVTMGPAATLLGSSLTSYTSGCRQPPGAGE